MFFLHILHFRVIFVTFVGIMSQAPIDLLTLVYISAELLLKFMGTGIKLWDPSEQAILQDSGFQSWS